MSEPTNREVAVLNAALELRPAERAAYLDEACAGDAALRQQVEALLRADAAAEGFLEAPPAGLGAPRTVRVTATLTEKPGDKIGHYKLLQQIGEGGCGVVYMAEQEEPVRRRVALKVIKLGMDTKQVIARFDAERQALALMDHPNIAKVLEACATETGRPYFVMELVRGIKITDFCDDNKLSTADRLKLFIQVCQAIQHAHQKGIIHRDIKPSNILVTINDGVPVPKVIDFGIAKATAGRLTDQTLFTAFEQFIGTPAYMSPEQAVMTSLDIDTRSDIYSLGVLLYELLTGRTPFDQKELLAAGLDEMRRTIREKEPPRPSTRLSAMAADALTTTAKRFHTDAPKLLHAVQGDLDWIVMKCLEKDRARRYETANGVATDILRHLNCEPVVARPPSRLYEFQKAVRRHKFGFAAGATVALVLTIGVIVSAWEAIRATRAKASALAEKQRADEETAKQELVNRFLNEMLASADPEASSILDQSKGRNVTVVQVLNAAAQQVKAGVLEGRPAIEAAIRRTLGKTYLSLGQLEAAEPQLGKAMALNRQVYGAESEQMAGSLSDLARLRYRQGNLRQAEELARETLAIQWRLRGRQHTEVARALSDVAELLWAQSIGSPRGLNRAKAAEAEKIYREALAMQRKLLSSENRDLARTVANLGRLLDHEGKLEEAESLTREALQMQKRLLGPEHPDVSHTMRELAVLLHHKSKEPEAENLCRAAIAIQHKMLGSDHPELGDSLYSLGLILNGKNKIEDSEAAYRESLAIRSKAMGTNNLDVVWCWRMLAENMITQKRLPEAEDFYRLQLPIWARIRGADSDGYLETLRSLVTVLESESKSEEIVALYKEVLAEQRKTLGNDSPAVAETLNSFAAALRDQGKLVEAKALIEGQTNTAAEKKAEPH